VQNLLLLATFSYTQEDQLSQRDRNVLHVVKYFAQSMLFEMTTKTSNACVISISF